MKRLNLLGLIFMIATTVSSCAGPQIIAHRGASGELPEHTLEAYHLALEHGADFLEPDLVMSKDGVLIIRHENEISSTTNVSEVFPNLKTKKNIDGEEFKGWFTEDLTWQQIQKLRARQRLDFRDQSFNDKFKIVSFEEFLVWYLDQQKKRNRSIGIVPELKHSSYHMSLGFDMEKSLIDILEKYGLNKDSPWIYIQSFEVLNLKRLKKLSPLRKVQLLLDKSSSPADQVGKTYEEMITQQGLSEIATYAEAIGPWKDLILPRDDSNRLMPATKLVEWAQAEGLKVFPYTFRDEDRYLSKQDQGNPVQEYLRFKDLKIDAFFTDFPKTAKKALGK